MISVLVVSTLDPDFTPIVLLSNLNKNSTPHPVALNVIASPEQSVTVAGAVTAPT